MDTVRRKNCLLPIREIKPNPRNAHTHSKAQICQIAESVKLLGFGAPVLVDETFTLIAGEGRFKAAELLGIGEIPAVQLLGLSEAQKRALALADNKIADNAGWDRERLAIELPELAELLVQENLDISVTGFSPAEIDQLQIDFEENSKDPSDEIDQGWQTGPLVSRRGSLWILDQHRLLCGDARSEADLDRLLGSDRAGMAFLDVPYNVRVRSVSGRGRTKHPEFAFASGEMSRLEYVEFLHERTGQLQSGIARRRRSLRVLRLAPCHRNRGGRRTDLRRRPEHRRVGQVQRGPGFVLPQPARVHRCLPCRQVSAPQQHPARPAWSFAFECMDLSRREHVWPRTDGGAALTSNR